MQSSFSEILHFHFFSISFIVLLKHSIILCKILFVKFSKFSRSLVELCRSRILSGKRNNKLFHYSCYEIYKQI